MQKAIQQNLGIVLLPTKAAPPGPMEPKKPPETIAAQSHFQYLLLFQCTGGRVTMADAVLPRVIASLPPACDDPSTLPALPFNEFLGLPPSATSDREFLITAPSSDLSGSPVTIQSNCRLYFERTTEFNVTAIIFENCMVDIRNLTLHGRLGISQCIFSLSGCHLRSADSPREALVDLEDSQAIVRDSTFLGGHQYFGVVIRGETALEMTGC
jgi:hypothetical protein